MAKELNLKSVHLMNDLEAIAFAVPRLRESDVQTLNSGAPAPEVPEGCYCCHRAGNGPR